MTGGAPNAETFDLDEYLANIDTDLLGHTLGRIELTKMDVLAFALVYLSHHLRGPETGDQVSLADFHLDLARSAQNWVKPLRTRAQFRDVYVAPRNCGKSTWLFLILPMWAAAHGHRRFVAAFADSATQAEGHLMTFRTELESNQLLQADFPDLCRPAVGTYRKAQIASARGQIIQENGFTFMARGIDTAVAGMKVGALRPDVIIMDDVEPDESNYSAAQCEKRRETIESNILPLNDWAHVVWSGTVTMSGSLVHQLVRTVTSTEKPELWIEETGFNVHYYPAILSEDDGRERSIWPVKWPIAELQGMRHQRAFMKNFMNLPVGTDGGYWAPADIQIAELESYPRTIISVDPAVTSKDKSDRTGLAVLSQERTDGPVYVRYAAGVRMAPKELRYKLMELLELFPETLLVLVESNQGGDLWADAFFSLPVKIHPTYQSTSKEVRAAGVLNDYQRGRVFHTDVFTMLNEELLTFPNSLHDDVLDAVVTGVRFFLPPRPKGYQRRPTSRSYL
jgi:phage terminase large subunit-like protein